MDKRRAKRVGCSLLANAIDDLLTEPNAYGHIFDPETGADLDEADQAKVAAAWRELEAELLRRAGDVRTTREGS